MRGYVRVLFVALGALGVLHAVGSRAYVIDLEVYRLAGQFVVDGHASSLYDTNFLAGPSASLPFTYPPFAAVLAVPLGAIPHTIGAWVFAVIDVALLWWIVGRAGAALWRVTGAWGSTWRLGATALALWTVPVHDVLGFGQLGVFLMALCIFDVERDGSRLQGTLVGLGAGIKLVPAIFVPYLAITGRTRAAVVAVATFVGTAVVGAVLLPHAGVTYWTSVLWDSDRIGTPGYFSNQSVHGVLVRTFGAGPIPSLLWLVVVAALCVGGLWCARLVRQDQGELAAIVLVGLLSVLISPVSWTHHCVWIVPAILVVLSDLTSRRRTYVAGVALAIALIPLTTIGNRWHQAGHGGPVVWLMTNAIFLDCVLLVVTIAAESDTVGRRFAGSVRRGRESANRA